MARCWVRGRLRPMTEQHVAVVVCGNAGTGKSTLGARLAAEMGAALLDMDTCTERMARLVLVGHGLSPDDRDSPEYKALLRDPVYETVFDIARENLRHVSCVIVGPFTRERRDPTWPTRLSDRLGAPVEFVYVDCEHEAVRQRLEARANPRDVGKLADWNAYLQQSSDSQPPPFPHRLVDTTPP